MKNECTNQIQRTAKQSLSMVAKTVFAIVVLGLAGGLTQSCGSKASTARRIEQALEYDIEAGKRFMVESESDSTPPESRLFESAKGRRSYVSAMQTYLSSAKLPNDFRDSFLEHVAAHFEMARLEESLGTEVTIHGGSSNPDEEMVEIGKQGMLQYMNAKDAISDTYDRISCIKTIATINESSRRRLTIACARAKSETFFCAFSSRRSAGAGFARSSCGSRAS